MWEGPEALWGNLTLIWAPAYGAQDVLAHHGTVNLPVRQMMPLPFCDFPKLGLFGCCFYLFLGFFFFGSVLHSLSSAHGSGIVPQHSVISFAPTKLYMGKTWNSLSKQMKAVQQSALLSPTGTWQTTSAHFTGVEVLARSPRMALLPWVGQH